MKDGGADSMVCWCYLRNVQDLLADGKTRMEDDLKNHSKGQQSLLEQWFKIIRFQREIYQDFINLARKCYLGSFFDMS